MQTRGRPGTNFTISTAPALPPTAFDWKAYGFGSPNHRRRVADSGSSGPSRLDHLEAKVKDYGDLRVLLQSMLLTKMPLVTKEFVMDFIEADFPSPQVDVDTHAEEARPSFANAAQAILDRINAC